MRIPSVSRFWIALARLHRKLRPQGSPILIYQMGKVGSRSVYESLDAARVRSRLYHVHLLNNLDRIEEATRASYENPSASVRAIAMGRRVRRKIDDNVSRSWRVISLVRDPVARNISAFFENIEELIPGARQRFLAERIGIEELTEIFVRRYRHRAPLQWFDSQVRDLFGIDVYRHPFPYRDGFLIVDQPPISLLIMRLEDLSRCFTRAIEAHLHLPGVPLVAANRATQRWYDTLYGEFVSSVQLPESYLQSMYDSAFARHFYAPAEIERLRVKWQRNRTCEAGR